MHRYMIALVICLLGVLPAAAQTQDKIAAEARQNFEQAQQALTAAEQAGAATYAKTVYDDAAWRIRFAQENWNANKREQREQARLRSIEGLWAARAALAKARWVGTNEALRGLQADIRRFGGANDMAFAEESPTFAFDRGSTSKDRIAFAQAAVDQAKAAGAEPFGGTDLKTAQQYLDTARQIVRGTKNSDQADHLAFVAEMMARRAYYLARASEAGRSLPTMQVERTRLAQEASERQAAAERAEREAAQRAAAELQRQLEAEQANRAAQSAELDRLRNQVEENRRAIVAQQEQDRLAREEAERRLDEAFARYENAVASGTASDVESLRRQIEDQQIQLRAIQERERLNEQAMAGEIDRLRNQLQSQQNVSADVAAQQQAELNRRQQELEQMRREREADLQRRQELERQQQAAIAEAQRRRQDAEAQAQAMREQMQQMQQQTTQAQQDAQRAAQAAEQSRQQAQQAQAELERTRQELANRDAETRRLRLEQELSRIAQTRSDSRGLIVTLPGIFFDTGKSTLKPGARNTLDKLAAQLGGTSGVSIAVEGHTDSVGSEQSNMTLSERRATAVRDYLVSKGVPTERITSSGRGESTPIATNNTAAGRQQNRRVELVITQ